MRGAIRKMIQPILWRSYRWYLSKKRWYRYEGLEVCVHPSVFHPGFLLSTKIFLNFIRGLPLQGKTVLELGAGSGLIALWTARAGAIVTASDINPAALRSIEESMDKNELVLTKIQSDLFDDFPSQQYDFIFINPPFYPQKAKDDREKAFFCGENFEYYEKLFVQLRTYVHPDSKVYMILTDDCDLGRIAEIAVAKDWSLDPMKVEKSWGEQHEIYQLTFA